MNPATTQRLTADERRVEILAVAQDLFAERGLYGTSTDEIARRAGISQPYLFRLFGTKKELYIATVEGCFRETLEMFQDASAGKTGEEALKAISKAYHETVLADPHRLQGQMQAYAACDDPDVRAVCRKGYGRLVEHVEAVADGHDERHVVVDQEYAAPAVVAHRANNLAELGRLRLRQPCGGLVHQHE